MKVKNNFPTDFVVDNGLLRNRLRRFLSLSKKSNRGFFDKLCERVFCRKAKYDTRKCLKSAFSDAR